MKEQERAREILRILKRRYKKAGPFAVWSSPLELVVATMLSAQCTDERVNKVTPALFLRYKTAADYANAHIRTLEKLVYSTGYYKSKARHLNGIGRMLDNEFNGKVPQEFDSLTRLPGISKKSACIVAAKAFKIFYGVAVDTHVFRIAPRLGWTQAKTRDAMALDLERLFPSKEYLNVNEFLITLGRDVCSPGIPKCNACVVKDKCPSSQRFIRFTKNRVKKDR